MYNYKMTVYLIDICLSNCYGIIFKKIHSMFFTSSQPGLVVVIIEPFKCEDPKVDWECQQLNLNL
jgi:hypothetical protein